ncbi:MAG: HDOD domain-containing protein [Campylobacterales bacterium]|nr:HDOD domain-containing protein [Campylobacterales bacterium]
MNEAITKKIKALPPLPESVTKIQAICNNPDSSISDLIKVVEKDPLLTANLLKAANSPLYGFSKEIKNIQQAVSLFGMATVKGFAIANAVRSSFKIDLTPYHLTKENFLKISELQNSLAINWVSKIDRKMLDVLATASFLIEIGKVVVSEFVKQLGKADEFADKIGKSISLDDISKIEKEYIEVSSEEVAAEIFEHWNFEADMVDTMKYMNNPFECEDKDIQKYALVLFIVKSCVNIKSQLNPESIDETLKIIDDNGFDKLKFLEAIQKVK